MPDVNIKYQKGIVNTKAAEIEADIQSLLEDKAAAYEQILSAFSVSQCNQATALRDEIEKEKRFLGSLQSFYTELMDMIRKASKDMDLVEDNYAEAHVTK